MKTRLILIVLAVAAFAWGFSALVEHSGQTMRPESAGVPCEDWTGEDCAARLRR